MQVRHREGVECLDAIDTLLVHLLADGGDVARLEAFAAAPNQAVLPAVRGALEARGRYHALALLAAGAGNVAAALCLWKVRLLANKGGTQCKLSCTS